MKKNLAICSLLIIVFGLLTGCNNPFGGASEEEPNLIISLAGTNARFSYPPLDADLAQMNAVLVVTKEGGAATEHKFAGDKPFSLKVAPGNYTVELSLFYKNGSTDVPLAKMAAPEPVTVVANEVTEKQVTVTRQFEVAGVTVSPTFITVAQSGTRQFSAVATLDQDIPSDFTWKLTPEPAVGSGTAISADGLLTVGSAQTGSLTVTATSTLMDVSRSVNVTVGTPSPEPMPDDAKVTVTGDYWVGSTLTAAANLAGTSTYQWKRNGDVIHTDKTYTLAANDVGKVISVEVTNNAYNGIIAGALKRTVTLPPLPGNPTVTISGTPTVGQTLTANATGFPSGNLTYQWKRGGANISGACNPTYTLQNADSGHAVSVEVSHPGYSGSKTSAAVTVTGGTTPPTGNTFNVSNADQWAAAVSAIDAAGNGTSSVARKTYTINITGSFSISGTYSQTFTPMNIDITIKGNGNTISLSSRNILLSISSLQTVTLEDLNLVGYADNIYPLISMGGSSFIMNNCKISGNIIGSTGNTGAVSVSAGTFTMIGGEVSGNKGGGVFVNGGTFIMNGGKIWGNTAANNTNNGGGVYVRVGNFRITNGIVYGSGAGANSNIAINGGAALYKEDSANPTAEYGTFSGSTWTRNGDLTTTNDTIEVVDGELVSGGTPPPVKTLIGIAVTTLPNKTVYQATDLDLDFTGMVVTATYSDGTTEEVSESGSTGYTKTSSFVASIPGSYLIEIKWQGMTTSFGVTVMASVYTPLPDVSDQATWNTAVSQITTGGTYLINIVESFNKTGGSTVTFGTVTDINVTINGNGHTITLSNNGSLLRIGANQTVTLSGLTLQGKTGNNISLVYIDGGAFTINSGSMTGNEADLNNGNEGGIAGVIIRNDGTFTMNGGALANNSGSVGGVWVFGGTFTMNGGKMKGNSGSLAVGGVNVMEGTFTMNGGEVSGNTSGGTNTNETAGGVDVNYTGIFNMNGGEVSGNSGGHGGVAVNNGGTFTMKGGKVSGNTASGDGGGVYLSNNSTFNMIGGEVSGNTATKIGGGVYLLNNSSNCMFFIENGIVYGSDAAVGLKNTAAVYAALYVGNNTRAERGTFSGSTWTNKGSLTSSENTIRVLNGDLQ